MRTTLTLEPDVARLVKEEVHRRRTTLKDVVNDALRASLSGGGAKGGRAKRYRVVPHRTSLLPGLDRTAFNRLADELEDDAVLSRFRADR
jgi:hypothetical protein